jgi:hypothetical protein
LVLLCKQRFIYSGKCFQVLSIPSLVFSFVIAFNNLALSPTLGLQATQLGLNDFSLQQVFPLAFIHELHQLQLHDYSIQELLLVLGLVDAQELSKMPIQSFMHS